MIPRASEVGSTRRQKADHLFWKVLFAATLWEFNIAMEIHETWPIW